MKILKLTVLISLLILVTIIPLTYFTYFKTTHIGGELGVTPASYSKNWFYVYMSQKDSGRFLTFFRNIPKTFQIEGADYDTFEYIDDGFAKDKDYFYYPSIETGKIERVKLDLTKPLRTTSVELRDDSLLYSKYYILPDRVLHVMKHNGKYTDVSGNSFARIGLMKGYDINNPKWYPFDYETFTPFPCSYAKDKNGVYYISFNPLIKIENVDIESFTAKLAPYSETNHEACYATDKDYQYFHKRDKNNNLEIDRKPLDNFPK